MTCRHVAALARLIVFATALAMPVRSAAQRSAACPDAAQQYWEHFRSAALGSDVQLVANNTRFPFKVGGTLDSSPRKELSRQAFIRLFPRLLKTDPGLSPTPTTMRALVSETKRLPPASCNASGNQIRVGTWVFELKSEGWRFVEAFVDD